MSEWKECTLQDVVEQFIDYRGKTPPKQDSGIPLVTAKIVKGGRIQTPSEFISEETYTKWMTRGFPKKNDVVLTTEAPLGEVALLKRDDVALAQRIILIRGDPQKLNNAFLKYFFQSRQGQYTLQSRASGTTVFGIKASVLKKIPIPVPPLPEQKAIAAVLSSLDDKIDLLHRQNTTLEAMAQTLFRHWFVDGASDEWEEGTLGDLVAFAYGKALKKSNRTGEGYPVIGSSGIVGFHSEYLVEAPGIVTGRKGTLGKVIYLSDNFYPIDTTFFIKSKNDSHELYFEYFLLKSMNFENMNTDSAVPGLNRNIALASDTLIPPQAEITQFNCLVKPLFHKILANKTQIQTLEKLRDTLLPKLMSGEVRVKF